MQLGMRSSQALQVQASPSNCDMSFNHTALPINGCHFQNYLFHAQDFLKGGKVTKERYLRRRVKRGKFSFFDSLLAATCYIMLHCDPIFQPQAT